MTDDFLTREWAENQPRFAANVHKLAGGLFAKIGDTFAALNRAQFDAPWRRPLRRVRIAGLR